MKLINILLYMMGVFSTMYIISIGGVPISTWLALLSIIVIIVLRGKMILLGDKWFFAFLCAAALTTIISLFSDPTYLGTQIITFGVMAIIYFCVAQMKLLPDRSISVFFYGLRLSCVLHIVWCLIQFFSYKLLGMDINNIVFVDMLHMAESASSYRNGVLSITGFCWHPSNLVPVLVISCVLLKRWYIWAVSFFIVIYAHSGTALLGLMITFLFTLLLYIPRLTARIQKISLSAIFLFILAIVGLVFLLVKTDFFLIITEKYQQIYDRIFGGNDMSSQVHMRYYAMLPFIWSKAGILEILFGCGLGCSGVLFSRYFYQYTQLGAWVVESDPMNHVYSVGIIGALLFYGWLIHLLLKNRGQNKRYLVILACLMICGVTYNVQYVWVIMVELLMGVCMERKIDIFQSDKLLWNKKTVKNNFDFLYKLCNIKRQ